MEKKRVVITGLGALTPIGNSVDEYWENLIAGKSGADFISMNIKDSYITALMNLFSSLASHCW